MAKILPVLLTFGFTAFGQQMSIKELTKLFEVAPVKPHDVQLLAKWKRDEMGAFDERRDC